MLVPHRVENVEETPLGEGGPCKLLNRGSAQETESAAALSKPAATRCRVASDQSVLGLTAAMGKTKQEVVKLSGCIRRAPVWSRG